MRPAAAWTFWLASAETTSWTVTPKTAMRSTFSQIRME